MSNETVKGRRSLVKTIKERCRVCYTCVRECPAKAIRISGGQAEIMSERCIGCGNCVRVCSQNAKVVQNSIAETEELLRSDQKVAACFAPSFPAEFQELDYKQMVGMVRALGFKYVTEVAYGADLVAQKYRELVDANKDKNKQYIATTCPAIVSYIEKYHPALVDRLAPISSPMVATARVMHRMYGEDLKIVFIGPCIAKKAEADRDDTVDDIDVVITFSELRELLDKNKISADQVTPSEFDPPHPAKGTLFPIGRGMLEAAELREDLVTNEVVAADGTKDFIQALKESEDGSLDASLLELLCCNGCIMGTGMTTQSSQFTRRNHVSKYARQKLKEMDQKAWQETNDSFEDVDLTAHYTGEDIRIAPPSGDELKTILKRIGKLNPEDELNCGACGYETCLEHAVAIHKGFAENEMCLPYTIEKLKETASELSDSYEQLVNTKNALAQSEKLASMGQLAAGIAHEVNNPLGVVLLYAHLILEQTPPDSEAYEDLKMIVDQADRAKKIVGGLLNFARKNKVVLTETDIIELVDHNLKAIILPDNIAVKVIHLKDQLHAEVDSDQLTQVLSNLVSNAIEAMPEGGILTLITSKEEDFAVIKVKDIGTGIDDDAMKKIFEPFFTTKQIGKGTGLGLAVTYGIIKMHRGQILVDSNADPNKGPTGTTFTVKIPIKGSPVGLNGSGGMIT
jgi:iron only hydrogenase large subunit-like protein/nitrogen-specific signal transduction histidine kinase